jgi:hypothetical protein
LREASLSSPNLHQSVRTPSHLPNVIGITAIVVITTLLVTRWIQAATGTNDASTPSWRAMIPLSSSLTNAVLPGWLATMVLLPRVLHHPSHIGQWKNIVVTFTLITLTYILTTMRSSIITVIWPAALSLSMLVLWWSIWCIRHWIMMLIDSNPKTRVAMVTTLASGGIPLLIALIFLLWLHWIIRATVTTLPLLTMNTYMSIRMIDQWRNNKRVIVVAFGVLYVGNVIYLSLEWLITSWIPSPWTSLLWIALIIHASGWLLIGLVLLGKRLNLPCYRRCR